MDSAIQCARRAYRRLGQWWLCRCLIHVRRMRPRFLEELNKNCVEVKCQQGDAPRIYY